MTDYDFFYCSLSESDQSFNEYTVLNTVLFSLLTGLMMQRLKITNHSPSVRWGRRFCCDCEGGQIDRPDVFDEMS